MAGTASTTLPPGQFETDLVTLLLVVPEGRAALLPLVEPADVLHKGLWAIVGALQQHPERAGRGAAGRGRGPGHARICWPSS